MFQTCIIFLFWNTKDILKNVSFLSNGESNAVLFKYYLYTEFINIYK